MRISYLDNAATTPVDEKVLKAMLPYFSEKFGNPGSMHQIGLEANGAVDEARKTVAKLIGASPEEIIFLSGGTESDNLALIGTARALKEKGNHIITTNIEHHAVFDTCEYLEEQGFKITYVPVEKNGIVNPKEIEKAITPKTILISVMHANNEIGTIQPIAEIAKIAKSKDIVMHTDACQSAGYLDIDVNKLGIDLMTLNGGKIYGPKGIGILYAKKGIILQPLIYGGGQEKGVRSGTENVPLIVGFAKALDIAHNIRERESKRLIKLRDKLVNGLKKKINNIHINGDLEKRLPNNVNISFLGIEGESMILHLDSKGICASTGSACSSHSLEPSHVIKALGLSDEASHGSLRFTLGRHTKEEDINKVLKELPKIVEALRKISPIAK